jgi:hypothetical protein
VAQDQKIRNGRIKKNRDLCKRQEHNYKDPLDRERKAGSLTISDRQP